METKVSSVEDEPQQNDGRRMPICWSFVGLSAFAAVAIYFLYMAFDSRLHPLHAVVDGRYTHQYDVWTPTCVLMLNESKSHIDDVECKMLESLDHVLEIGVSCVSEFPTRCWPLYKRRSSIEISVVFREKIGSTDVLLEPMQIIHCDNLDPNNATRCLHQAIEFTRNITEMRAVYTWDWPTFDMPWSITNGGLIFSTCIAALFTLPPIIYLVIICVRCFNCSPVDCRLFNACKCCSHPSQHQLLSVVDDTHVENKVELAPMEDDYSDAYPAQLSFDQPLPPARFPCDEVKRAPVQTVLQPYDIITVGSENDMDTTGLLEQHLYARDVATVSS